jgi:hypothetical protein
MFSVIMENELRDNLLLCATAYSAASKRGLSTLGRLAAGDWRFFEHLNDDQRTFTARKYDEVIQWFSDNWPETAVWPEAVARPTAAEQAGAA